MSNSAYAVRQADAVNLFEILTMPIANEIQVPEILRWKFFNL